MADDRFHFVTDTATLVVFDLAAMKHHLYHDGDWWTMAEDELRAVRDGEAMFVNLGSDGRYDVAVAAPSQGGVTALLRCPSGRVFVGAAEEVTGEGMEPECIRGGRFMEMLPGTYRVQVARAPAAHHLTLSFTVSSGTAVNDIDDLLRV